MTKTVYPLTYRYFVCGGINIGLPIFLFTCHIENFKILAYFFPAAKRHFGWTVRWMARLNGGKAQTSMSPQLLPGWGNKNILWRDFSVFEKMFSLLFDSKCCSVHCVFSTSITVIKRRRYSHFFIRPFEKRSYYVIPPGVHPSVRPLDIFG